ncbi:MAG TPA: hypothetical protein VIR56_04570 [Solimonas sp.]
MFYQHLTAATAAIVMTTATFVGINAYAGAVVQDGRIVASLQTAAAAQIDTQLQVALQQSQREVQDNIVSSVLTLAPAVNVGPAAMMVALR